MKAVLIAFFLLACPFALADTGSVHIDEKKKEASAEEREKRARTSPAFEAAAAALKDMEENWGKQEFEKLAAEHVENIMKGLDNGKLTQALAKLLTENETYIDEDHKKAFGDKFEALSPFEKKLITIEYTLARKRMRAALHDAVAKIFKDSKDTRIQVLNPKLEEIKKGNLTAYDEALERIRRHNLDRPICFTCGEQVSDKEDWEFYDAMNNVVKKALVEVGLDNEQGSGPYFAKNMGRTSSGKIVSVGIFPDGSVTGATGLTTLQEAKANGSDPGLVSEIRKHYKKVLAEKNYDFNQVFPNNPAGQSTVKNFFKWADNQVLSKPAAPALAAAGVVGTAGTSDKGVQAYLKSVDGHPSAKDYPTPEVMAAKLGLVDEEGKAYLEYKGAGKHFDGTQEYGVRMLWDKIRYADPSERARVMKILKEIAKESGPTKYKVVNGQDGYCIWCNIRNDGTSTRNMAELKYLESLTNLQSA